MNLRSSYSGDQTFKEIEEVFKKDMAEHLAGLANVWRQDGKNHLHANFTVLTCEQRERILDTISDPIEAHTVMSIMREEIGEINIQSL